MNHRDLARRFADEVINGRNFSVLRESVTEDYVYIDPSIGTVNRPGESGDSMLIEPMLPHWLQDCDSRSLRVSPAAYHRSTRTGACC